MIYITSNGQKSEYDQEIQIDVCIHVYVHFDA